MARNCRKVRCGVVAPGRKTVAARDPGLVPALKRLLEPATLGDPMRPLLWVSKSMDKLAAILTAMGHPIGADTVRRELVKLGFSRQYNRKALRRYECGDPLTRHCGEAGHPFGERRLAPHQSRAAACSPLSSCNRFRLGRRPFRFRNANKILHRRFLRRALGRFNTVTSYAVAHGGDFARMRTRSGPPKGAQESPDMVVATITTKRVAEGAPTDFILASGFSRASPRSMASRIAGQTRLRTRRTGDCLQGIAVRAHGMLRWEGEKLLPSALTWIRLRVRLALASCWEMNVPH